MAVVQDEFLDAFIRNCGKEHFQGSGTVKKKTRTGMSGSGCLENISTSDQLIK